MKKIKLNKRDVVALTIFACLVVGAFCYVLYQRMKMDNFAIEMERVFSKNQNTVFSIDKIVTYSSASAIDNSEGKTMQDLNICQFADIAIYIDNMADIRELVKESKAMGVSTVETNDEAATKVKEHSIKELYIDNIKINSSTSKGRKTLAYKNPYKTAEFGEINYEEQQERINFDIISTNVDNERTDYSNPTFYADCSNPITLGFMNRNIVTGYSVSEANSQITFDGKILKSVGIDLEDIACTVNFDIHITNNLNQEFICSLDVKIPLESENRSIYDGYMYNLDNNLQNKYKFFKK